MSALGLSPYQLGSKRFLEGPEEERSPLSELTGGKRHRQAVSPGRCAPREAAQASYAVGSATVAALRALFPHMNDKVIADVLAEYGDNIDAAIKHLNELRLSGAVAQQQGAQQPQAGGAGGAKPAAAPAAAAAAAAVAPQQPQQQQQPSTAPEPAGPDAGGGAAAEAPPPPAKSAAEWVDIVVQQMSEARSVEDARQRAAAVLQAFEQAVVQHAKQAEDPERLRHQLAELAKENHLLKRAVAIQNARIQELGAKEAEVQQLRQMLEGFQQKVHALEVQNYSLALHLKQATDSRDPLRSHKNPDIF